MQHIWTRKYLLAKNEYVGKNKNIYKCVSSPPKIGERHATSIGSKKCVKYFFFSLKQILFFLFTPSPLQKFTKVIKPLLKEIKEKNWYWSYYPHTLRNPVSPVCGIFLIAIRFKKSIAKIIAYIKVSDHGYIFLRKLNLF